MYRKFPILIFPLLLFFLFIRNYTSTNHSRHRACRCLPHEPCWPSPGDWAAFNTSVNGHLISLRPVGAVCHGDEFDQALCAAVRETTNNSAWRAEQPATLQSVNWESTWASTTNCDPFIYRDSICTQGRIPLFSVLAQSASEIQTAIRFARTRNLRVVIKNTGHDSIGRSSGPASFQINVSRLKSIQVVDDFVPNGGSVGQGQAVTIAPGNLALEVAQVGVEHGFNTIMGLCTTVGVTGGYVQGGGAGLLGPTFGMASDNVLEFQVVTADGNLVTANIHQNSDLFWALRGGGGGTFGVVVNTTVRTLPDIPGAVFTLGAAIPRANPTFPDVDTALWDFTREIVNALPVLKEADNTTGGAVIAGVQDTGVQVITEILFPNLTDTTAIQERLDPLLTALNDLGFTPFYQIDITPYPALSTYFNLPRPLDLAGTGRIEGSVFISNDLFSAPYPSGTNRIMDTVGNLTYRPGDLIEIFLSGGGQVAANKDFINSALNPSWRKTAMLLTYRRTLPPDATVKQFVDSPMPYLRALETPRMGSFVNTAEPEEPDFQRAFWGSNYPELLRVKRRWDPEGVFVVRLGVGSEGWDEEGICRVRRGGGHKSRISL
ncbi:hypothetical protein BDV06DRAFT_226371 [Aspergillus oleicola]